MSEEASRIARDRALTSCRAGGRLRRLSAFVLPVLLPAAVLVLATGCSKAPPGSDPDGALVLQFWNGFSGPDGTTMESIVKQFNTEHKGKVRVQMQIIPWGTYYDKVTLGLAFGGSPDVFILHASRVPEYASHDALAPLDDLMASAGIGQSDFVPRAWKAGQWNGRRVALPLDCHPAGMFYNVDLFRKAGIESPPATFPEFLADAKKLTIDKNGDGKIDQWGFAFTDLHIVSTTFFDQFGGGLLAPDYGRSALGDPQSLQAVKAMTDLFAKYKVSPPPAGNDGMMGFETGKVAMAIQGIWMINELNQQDKLHYAAAPVPFFGPIKATWANSHCLCMPATATDERKRAGFEFIKYLSDHSLTWAKGGQVPVRKTILESEEFRALPIQSQFARQLPYATYEPFSVTDNQISTFADAAVEAALNQVQNPKEALDTAARRVNNVLSRQ